MNRKKLVMVMCLALLPLCIFILPKLLLIFISFLLNFEQPSERTKTWQTVFIAEEVGTIKFPPEWVVEEENGIIFVTDIPRQYEGYNTYLTGTTLKYEDVPSDKRFFPYTLFDSEIEIEQTVYTRPVLDNNAYVWRYEVTIDNETTEHLIIECMGSGVGWNEKKYAFFVVWDSDTATEDIVRDIGLTFNWYSPRK
ncbi:MAG: hypothetical protein FWG87_07390 [Defluviitaleaceae bacterium]|nr:hypothetical protein [Defluviitaleaceae bacterium]